MGSKIFIAIFDKPAEEFGTVEELMIAKSQCETVNAEYQRLGLESPEWVIDKINEASTEINNRVRGELERRLKRAKAQRSALRTAEEKRKDLDSQISDLESRLNQ